MFSIPPIIEKNEKPTAGEIAEDVKKWAAIVLSKLQISSASASDREVAAGFVWHMADTPDKSKVGVAFQTDNSGRVSSVAIAGRPRPKHGSSHGQHTTAFSVNREVIVSALIGRKENECFESMELLFDTLLYYPAISYDDSASTKDISLFIKGVVSSIPLRKYTVADLSKLYLEVREAIPGASLDTGIDGKSAGSGRANVIGKAEPSILNVLRQYEIASLNGNLLKKPEDIAATLRRLYDVSAEQTPELTFSDIVNMRQTFVMSIAQAFPGCYTRKGVAEALHELMMPHSSDIDAGRSFTPEDYATAVVLMESAAIRVFDIAQTLKSGNKVKNRPMPAAFTAALTENGSIQFDGRPNSIKDGASVGDHTCSEQMMKDAATGLLAPSGLKTTVGELRAGLEKTYEFINFDYLQFSDQPIFEQVDSGNGDKEIVLKGTGPLACYGSRATATFDNRQALKKLILELSDMDPNLNASTLVAEAAELYLKVMDDRPTAVNYAGPANNNGEHAALKQIADMTGERLNGRQFTPEQVLEAFMGLFDSRAAVGLMDKLSREDGDRTRYLDRIVEEFLFFATEAYPVLAACLEGTVIDKVKNLIKEKVLRIGTLPKGDEEFVLEEKIKEEIVGDTIATSRKSRAKEKKTYFDME